MLSLIQLQDEAIRRMMEPRTSERRHSKMRAKVLYKFYKREALKRGYTEEQVAQQILDVRDMYLLEMMVEGE